WSSPLKAGSPRTASTRSIWDASCSAGGPASAGALEPETRATDKPNTAARDQARAISVTSWPAENARPVPHLNFNNLAAARGQSLVRGGAFGTEEAGRFSRS